jgi:4-amino-4-deoxy-L-arabinose transferase-like glycosyltransferase
MLSSHPKAIDLARWRLQLLPALWLAAFFTLAIVLVSGTGMEVGFSWAEDDYLNHVDIMRVWLSAWWNDTLTPSLHHQVWDTHLYFLPHPPLYKWLAVLSQALLTDVPFPVAEKFPSAVALAVAATAVVLALRPKVGLAASLVAGVLLMTSPRVVGHAHFLTVDIYVLSGWMVAALCHVRWLETGQARWMAGVTLALGATLSCKLTGAAMLVPLGLTSLLVRGLRDMRALGRDALFLAGAMVLALGILCLVYPYTWDAPLTRLLEMVARAGHWERENPFSMLYLGQLMPYAEAPWHFTLVMTILVTPPLTLALALFGVGLHRKAEVLRTTALTHAAFWLLMPMVLSGFPKYDNERQILPLFGFVALLAGMGFSAVKTALAGRVPHAGPVLLAATLVVSLVTLERTLPFPLGYFSPLVGGARGAVALGFESTYLGEVLSRDVLASLTKDLPPGAGLSVQPAPRLGRFLQQRGYLRPDLQVTSMEGPYYIWFLRHLVDMPELVEIRRRGVLLAGMKHLGVEVAQLWYTPPYGPAPP